jgi:hypothetical protein
MSNLFKARKLVAYKLGRQLYNQPDKIDVKQGKFNIKIRQDAIIVENWVKSFGRINSMAAWGKAIQVLKDKLKDKQQADLKEEYTIHTIPHLDYSKVVQQDIRNIPKALLNVDKYLISYQLVMEDNSRYVARPIHTKEQINNIRRRKVTALEGILNGFLKKIIIYKIQTKEIILTFTERVLAPVPMVGDAAAKLSLSYNCMLEILWEDVKNRKDAWMIKKKLDVLNQEIFDVGADENAVVKMAKIARVNIKVYTVANELWVVCHQGDKFKNVVVSNHNGHAVRYDPVPKNRISGQDIEIVRAVYPELSTCLSYPEYLAQLDPTSKLDWNSIQGHSTPKPISIVEQCFKDDFMNNDSTPVLYPVMNKNKDIVAFKNRNGVITKSKDIFFGRADFDKNAQNPKYFRVNTIISRYFKDLKDKYDLQRIWRDPKLFEFVKASDFNPKEWSQVPENAETVTGFAYDLKRAYMQYRISRFFKHYLFPRMPTHWYQIESHTEAEKQQMIDLTGFCQIANIVIPAGLAYLINTKTVQENAVYITPVLRFFDELGIRFDIISIAFSHQKQDIDFSIQLTNEQIIDQHQKAQSTATYMLSQEDQDRVVAKYIKSLENNVIGSLIYSDSNIDFLSAIHTNNKTEQMQIRFQLGTAVDSIKDDIIRYIQPKVENTNYKLGMPHIHSFILGYFQIQLWTDALKVPFEEILKLKVDCIILKSANSEKLFEDQFSKWHCKGEITEPKRSDHINNLIENNVLERRTPSSADLNLLPVEILNSAYTEVTGMAGTGKTFDVMNWNLYDQCVCVPTNNLKLKFKKENPTVPVMTWNKQFETYLKAGERGLVPSKRYSNFVMDESSMTCKGMMDRILTHVNSKDANFVLIHDRAQLAPVMPETYIWREEKSPYFTNSEEYQKRKWHLINKTEQKRCKDEELYRRLCIVREKQGEKKGQFRSPEFVAAELKTLIEIFADRIISSDEMINLYRHDEEDIVLCGTNIGVDGYNAVITASNTTGKMKVKYSKNINGFANNQRLIEQPAVGQFQELAEACTVHVVQGLSLDCRIFISMTQLNHDPHLLYVAASRVHYLKQIYLVP